MQNSKNGRNSFVGRAKPNLTPDVTPHPSQCLGHVKKAWIRENHTRN